jgi:hypothetical protein
MTVRDTAKDDECDVLDYFVLWGLASGCAAACEVAYAILLGGKIW